MKCDTCPEWVQLDEKDGFCSRPWWTILSGCPDEIEVEQEEY